MVCPGMTPAVWIAPCGNLTQSHVILYGQNRKYLHRHVNSGVCRGGGVRAKLRYLDEFGDAKAATDY